MVEAPAVRHDGSFQQTFDLAGTQGRRFSALVRSLDAEEAAQVVPGMRWRAADVGTHVATVLGRYYANPARSATPSDLRMQNVNEVETSGLGLDVRAIADAIDTHLAVIGSVAPTLALDATFPFHVGLTVTTSAGWANLLSEFLVHGDDIARATGRTWDFPPAAVEGIWRNLIPAAAGWLRPEARQLDEVYELRFPFGNVRVWIHDGVISVDDARRPADHVIDVDDPVTFTLGVPWRRHLITDAKAALLASRLLDI